MKNLFFPHSLPRVSSNSPENIPLIIRQPPPEEVLSMGDNMRESEVQIFTMKFMKWQMEKSPKNG